MSHTIGQAKEDTQESNSNSNQSSQDLQNPGAISPTPVSGLSDTDYEFLFNQLLEGIAHGWHDRRIVKFFHQLGDRGKQSDWVAWLDRLRSKLLKLPVESKRHLGTLMIRFGELTQSAAEVKQIGAASHSLGKELLFGNNSAAIIWEYVGPDLSLSTEQMKAEQELSQRLPSDFVDLADSATEEESDAVADLAVESANASDESNLNLNIDEIIDLLVPGQNISPEEREVSLEDELVSNQKDTSSDLVSADELWAADLDDLSAEPEVERIESQPEINLDLDLDLDPEPDIPIPEVEQSIGERGVAADEESELPRSAANRLSAALQAFELESDSESPLTDESTVDNSATPAEEQSKVDLDLELDIEQSGSSIFSSPVSLDLDLLDPLSEADLDLSTASSEELDESTVELIKSWFNLGLKQVSAGEYDKAIASWDKALTINANLPEAWHNRGSALGRLGDYEAAVKSFQNALEIDPHNYQAWNDRAHALYQLQEWSGAIECWSRAIDIMPGNHLFWYSRGCSLEQLAKWTEAIASYEKALEIKPDFQLGRSRYINLVADNSRPN